MTTVVYSLPNIYDNPYVNADYYLDDKKFEFYFYWNNRSGQAMLDIYYLIEGVKTLLCAGMVCNVSSNLTSQIHSDYWDSTKNLSIINTEFKTLEPTQYSFDKEYLLLYGDGSEFVY